VPAAEAWFVRPHPTSFAKERIPVDQGLARRLGVAYLVLAAVVVANAVAFRILGNPRALRDTGMLLVAGSMPWSWLGLTALRSVPPLWGQIVLVWAGLALNVTAIVVLLRLRRRRPDFRHRG
jgi:hypothetical protein